MMRSANGASGATGGGDPNKPPPPPYGEERSNRKTAPKKLISRKAFKNELGHQYITAARGESGLGQGQLAGFHPADCTPPHSVKPTVVGFVG